MERCRNYISLYTKVNSGVQRLFVKIVNHIFFTEWYHVRKRNLKANCTCHDKDLAPKSNCLRDGPLENSSGGGGGGGDYEVQKIFTQGKFSLRADEIKPWSTPSAKQRRNPCSRLPAVYPGLSTRHDWPVKKGLCFVCRDRQSGRREIRNALPVIR